MSLREANKEINNKASKGFNKSQYRLQSRLLLERRTIRFDPPGCTTSRTSPSLLSVRGSLGTAACDSFLELKLATQDRRAPPREPALCARRMLRSMLLSNHSI